MIKSGTYVGPYTSIGANSTLENVHIENTSSSMTRQSRRRWIIDSLLGRSANVETAEIYLPEGRRLIDGENSQLKL